MMSWCAVATAAVVLSTAACRADPTTQERDTRTHPPQPAQINHTPEPPAAAPPSAVVPANPLDSRIRQSLSLLIEDDLELKDREISFIVSDGDVSVTGTVRTETERKRINDLAMGIPGVKSVANALLVSP